MRNMTKIRHAAVGALTLLATTATLLAGAATGHAEPTGEPLVDDTTQAQVRESAMAASVPGTYGFQDDFVNAIGPTTQNEMAEYRVPASVSMAQAILESNWGRSGLSLNDKNYFGIKCTSAGHGPIAIGCRTYDTEECTPGCHTTKGSFRVYASRDDSFRDHGRLLSTMSLYAPAFQYVDNPDQFAREIARHWATDPNYASKLITLMQNWDLYRFNSGVAADAPGPMFHQIRNAEGTGWSGFKPLAGAGTTQQGSAKDVAITGMPDGSAQTMIVGSDDIVYHQIRNAEGTAWSGFKALSGAGTTLPAKGRKVSIAGMPDGSTQALIVGSDGKVYHNIRNAEGTAWSGFAPVLGAGSNLPAGAKDLAIAAMPNGDAHVVIIGDDDSVYHQIRTAWPLGWTGFSAIPGAGTTLPAKGRKVSIAGMPDGSAQVLITGTDNAVYHTIRNAAGTAWSGFQPVSGAGTTVPAKAKDVSITAMPNNDAHVLIVGDDDTVYHQIRTAANPAWTGFRPVAGVGTTQGARAHKVSIAGLPDSSAQIIIAGR